MLAERRIKKKKERERKITWLILFHVLEEAPESVGRILVTRVRGLNPDLPGLFYPRNDRELRRHATVTQSRGNESRPGTIRSQCALPWGPFCLRTVWYRT